MRQLDLEVPVPAERAELLADTAGRLGVSLSELLTSSATAYARKAAGGSTPRGSSALRRTVGWGARPAEEAEAERVPVHLGPEILDLIESARRSVRWEAADGTTAPVTLEEYVLGAAERMIKSGSPPTRNSATEPAAAPAPSSAPATSAPRQPPLPPATLRWMLLGAGALTAVFLVLAVVLVLNRKPAVRAEVAGPPGPPPDSTPLLPPPGRAGTDVPPPASAADTARAGEAVSRWEHQAEARPSRGGGQDHTKGIDEILERYQGGGSARDEGYASAIEAAVRDVADLYPVPPALVKAVIRRESAFNPRAKSRVGAIGLMQLMPFNARKVGLRESELWDPTRNILGGTRLLAALLRYYNGDMVAALAAYNAKPRNPFAPLPKNGETPEYVTMVLRYYDEYTRQAGTGLGARTGSP